MNTSKIGFALARKEDIEGRPLGKRERREFIEERAALRFRLVEAAVQVVGYGRPDEIPKIFDFAEQVVAAHERCLESDLAEAMEGDD
jgi:hypothetical protein